MASDQFQTFLMQFVLLSSLLFASKHTHHFINSIGGGGRSGSGGFLSRIGNGVGAAASNFGIRGIKRAGSIVASGAQASISSLNRIGAKGVDKLRDYMDDKGLVEKSMPSETAGRNAFTGLKELAKDTINDRGEELFHRVAAKLPGTNTDKHQALAQAAAQYRQDRKELTRQPEGLELAKNRYSRDKLAYDMAKDRYENLINQSPQAQALREAQQAYDQASPQDKPYYQEKLDFAKKEYNNFLGSEPVQQAKKEMDEAQEQMLHSKNAYQTLDYQSKNADVWQEILPQQYEDKKSRIQSLYSQMYQAPHNSNPSPGSNGSFGSSVRMKSASSGSPQELRGHQERVKNMSNSDFGINSPWRNG